MAKAKKDPKDVARDLQTQLMELNLFETAEINGNTWERVPGGWVRTDDKCSIFIKQS